MHTKEHQNLYWLSTKCILASDQSSVRSWLVQPIKELSSAAGRCAGRGCALIRQLANCCHHFYCCFSSNHIRTLADFADCHYLEELYLRNNSIPDINELSHLKGLSKLRVLWLEGNPCTKHPAYRTSLLRMLPKLHRLDNIGCMLVCMYTVSQK